MTSTCRALCMALIFAASLLPAAQAASIIFPEMPLDPTVRLVPSSRSWDGAIASNGRTMMAVSAGDSLAVIRIDEQGRVVDPLGITIDSGRTLEAGIAWNGHNFIVHALRSKDWHRLTYVVSPEGRLTQEPIDQGPSACTAFSLAGNGRDVVVTCGGESRFIGADGRFDGPALSTPGVAAVTLSDGNDFIVFTTQASAPSSNRVSTWRINRNGVLGAAEPVQAAGLPTVTAAKGRDGMLVAWTVDDSPMVRQRRRRIWTAMFDDSGHLLRGATLLQEATIDSSSLPPAVPAAGFDENEFLVTWLSPTGTGGRVTAQRFAFDGSPSGEPFVMEESGWPPRNGIATTDDGHVAAISYRKEERNPVASLYYPILRYATSFEGIRAVAGSVLLSDGASQGGLALTTAPSGAFAAWTETVAASYPGALFPGPRNIMGVEIHDAAAAPASVTVGAASGVFSPKVVRTDEGHTVFWSWDARRVSGGKVVDGSPFEIWTTKPPSAVAWYDSTYYTAWTGDHYELQAARLSATGKIIDYDARTLVPADETEGRWAVGFLVTRSALFVTWSSKRDRFALPQFWIGRIGNDVRLSTALGINLQQVDQFTNLDTRAAANDREILVAGNGVGTACRHVWRVAFDLSAPGAGKDVLCTPPDHGTITIPAWDGRNWWLVYNSSAKAGIYAIRLRDDLTTDGSPETITDVVASLADATAASNGFIVGYSREIEDLGRALRLFLRYVGPPSRREAVRR